MRYSIYPHHRSSCQYKCLGGISILPSSLKNNYISRSRTMPNKRGRAYQYDIGECDWIGERGQASEHYARRHCLLEDTPFACINCSETFGTEASMQRHRGLKKHLAKLAATGQPDVITSNFTMDLLDKFTVLSQSRSDSVWASRGRGFYKITGCGGSWIK